MAEINIKQLTDVNKVTANQDGTYKVTKDGTTSTAILDVMLNTVTLHLDQQYKSGNIRKEEYAQALVALYQATLNQATSIFLQKNLIEKQIEKEENQIELIKRQKIGFDEDFIIKGSEAYLQAYLSFLASLPNVENQPYPSSFTGQYHLNFNDEDAYKKDPNKPNGSMIKDTEAPIKLKFLDGIMGMLVNRIAYYQTKESDRDEFDSNMPCKPNLINGPDGPIEKPNPKP